MWKSLASFGLWRGKRGSSEFEPSIISLTHINKGWFHLACKGNGEVSQILHKWFHFLCGELGIHISPLAAASWLHCGRQWVLYFGRWSCPFRLTTCLFFGQSPVAHSRATLPMNEKWMCHCSLAGAMHHSESGPALPLILWTCSECPVGTTGFLHLTSHLADIVCTRVAGSE